MPTTIQDEQTPILQDIGSALIEATPQHWRVAVLELATTHLATGVVGLQHCVTSPEGHGDLVMPTDELMEATRRLQALCEQHGQLFSRVVFEIRCDSDDEWHFDSRWEYPASNK